MSVSLYYTATRIHPISLQEQTICDEIARRYDSQYPFGELYEGFCIYDLNKSPYVTTDENNVIFAGATKLPPICDMELFGKIVDWWLECLSEITSALPGAKWDVNIDDITIEWNNDIH